MHVREVHEPVGLRFFPFLPDLKRPAPSRLSSAPDGGAAASGPWTQVEPTRGACREDQPELFHPVTPLTATVCAVNVVFLVVSSFLLSCVHRNLGRFLSASESL